MSNKQHIIFDLDDTLIDTSHVYWDARNAFTKLFSHHNVPEKEIIDIFENIDEKNMQAYGLSPERYGHSMLQAFKQISKSHRIDQNKIDQSFIEELALRVPTTIPNLIDGALELLKWSSKRYTLSLLTRGIPEFQLKKIKALEIEKYFTTVQVVEKKGTNEFQNFLLKINANPSECWVVGDSIKSDINPAIALGIDPILYLYSHHTYYWRQEYGAFAEGDFYLAKSLSDAKLIISNPDNFKKINILT
jgi:putative hydrolase of the HAD superfamily